MLKNTILFLMASSFNLFANARYAAAHAHFESKSWTPLLAISVALVILCGAGMVTYWVYKGNK